jgi:hypothetical protein
MMMAFAAHRDQQDFCCAQQNFFSIGYDEASRPMEKKFRWLR